MESVTAAAAELRRIIDGNFYKITFSGPFKKNEEYFKVAVEPKKSGGKIFYQASMFFETKVKHENFYSPRQLAEGILPCLNVYRQADISADGLNVKIFVNKNGTCKIIKTPDNKAAKEIQPHNDEKNYIIKDGIYADWLHRAGIMGADGTVLAQKQKKFRQINRFLEMVSDVAGHIPDNAHIVDVGCGKSYLTFALYYYLNVLQSKNVSITGLDIKRDVVESCQKHADEFGFGKLKFYAENIETFRLQGSADMVVTLHACDTATDHALFNAVKWGARVILSVPCCQHELFGMVNNDAMKSLLKHGILKERFAALLTDGLRAALLEACGYKCAVMEFIDMEHTPKNIMLRAIRRDGVLSDEAALNEYFKTAGMFGVTPTLYKLLKGHFYGDKEY